ncbi:hypothetical protein KIPB_008401, partial [Kipferlia bialata]
RDLETQFLVARLKGHIYELNEGNEGNVRLSEGARDNNVSLSEDQFTFTGAQGYRSARCTHGAYTGAWYFEATPLPASHREKTYPKGHPLMSGEVYTPHFRLGWMRPSASLCGPVGHDRFAYGLRDVDCTLCHKRARLNTPTGEKAQRKLEQQGQAMAYGPGDTVGCFLYMPPTSYVPPVELEMVFRRRGDSNPVAGSDVNTDIPVPGSFIEFSVNGVTVQRVENIPFDRYYPAVSTFNYGSVRLHLGGQNTVKPSLAGVKGAMQWPWNVVACPNPKEGFKYPPPTNYVRGGWKPISSLWLIRAEVEFKAERETIEKAQREQALRDAGIIPSTETKTKTEGEGEREREVPVKPDTSGDVVMK